MTLLACNASAPPPVSSGASSGSGPTGGPESGYEGSETGGSDEGVLDEPCNEAPDLRFETRDLGLGELVLGVDRVDGCYEFSEVPLGCAGESTTVSVAVGDYDADGYPDLLLTGAESSGALMRNQGGQGFVDVTVGAGMDLTNASGSAWVDIDKDGDLDAIVTTWLGTANRLYVNQGGGSFVESATSAGVARAQMDMHGSTTVVVGDYDLDGWPDLYMNGWRPHDPPGPSPSRLYRNRGAGEPGTFDEVSVAAGLEYANYGDHPIITPGEFWFGYSSSFVDLDGDDFPELLAVADFGETSLWNNDGAGAFVESDQTDLLRTASFGMGHAWGDYDLDGDFDLYITSISESILGSCFNDSNTDLGSRFFEQVSPGQFEERGIETRTRCSGWAWGTLLQDFDADGFLDLVVTNGFTGDIIDADRYYVGTGSFAEPMPQCGEQVGINDAGQGRALAALDVEGDGDLDIVEARAGASPFVYVNQGNSSAWLRVQARGRSGLTSGRGAKIAVRADDSSTWQVREIGAEGSYVGHSELVAHFGLGRVATSADVRVCWPVSRTMQERSGVTLGQLVVLDEDDADINLTQPCATALLAD